jgi:hypothetical protein
MESVTIEILINGDWNNIKQRPKNTAAKGILAEDFSFSTAL